MKLFIIFVTLLKSLNIVLASSPRLSPTQNEEIIQTESRARRETIKQMILNNSNKFQNSISMPELPGPILEVTESNGSTLLEADVDLKSSTEISKFELSKSEKIKRQLHFSSPYLVFEDDWFNLMIYSVLEKNFPLNLKLDDPEALNYLFPMIFDPNNHSKTSEIPKDVHDLILDLFYEIIFLKTSQITENTASF